MNTHPILIVTVDGVPVSGPFFGRLISLTIIDREGIAADSLEMIFDDGWPRFASPRRGARVKVAIVAGLGSVPLGEYVIDRVENAFFPYSISVRGHSADLRAGMKTHKTRHWDNKTVKEVVEEIAADHSLQPQIADAVSGHKYSWLGQQDESDLNFLERLARRHGALFTIKSGRLLWLEAGAGKTASGEVIPEIPILAPSIIANSGKVWESDVERFKTIKAYWQDRAGAKRQEVIIEADPEAAGEHVLRDPFASKEEAEKAARAAVRDMLRGSVRTVCGLVGAPSLMAGQPISYVGVRSGIDGRPFILETVSISYSKKEGLRTNLEGRLKV